IKRGLWMLAKKRVLTKSKAPPDHLRVLSSFQRDPPFRVHGYHLAAIIIQIQVSWHNLSRSSSAHPTKLVFQFLDLAHISVRWREFLVQSRDIRDRSRVPQLFRRFQCTEK